MNNTKINDAWSALFEVCNIQDSVRVNGAFEITAALIRKTSQQEPRLMANFDSLEKLPDIFKEHGLGLLPLNRNSYLIAGMSLFEAINDCNYPIQNMKLPAGIQSIANDGVLFNEAQVNHCAYASGIIADFLGEDAGAVFPTVSGRMGSGDFTFRINGYDRNIDVEKAQIEIDAGYEGATSLALVETKKYEPKSFLVRQLYYPYRKWTSLISKPVRNVFLTYSVGIFTLREYEFAKKDNYSSLRLIKDKRYRLEDEPISRADIVRILADVKCECEPLGVPFPQADDFRRVVNICELLQAGCMTRYDVARQYDFVLRQSDYYVNACRYLGLVEGASDEIGLTEDGRRVMQLPLRQRQMEFVKLICQHQVFREIAQSFCEKGCMPEMPWIAEKMRSLLNGAYNDTTCGRRASTVAGWINWIFGLAND